MKNTKFFTGAILVFTLILLLNTEVKGQEEVGDNVFSAGIGLGTPYSYTGTARPAFLVTFDHGFKEIGDIGMISIGGLLAYQSLSYNYIYWDDYRANALYFGVRGLFHFTSLDIDKLDVYGGVSLGLRVHSERYNLVSDDYNETDIYPYAGLYAGGRYYLTDNFAVFSELLYDVTWLKLGVSLKF